MEHNTEPISAILIGSRAWNKNLDASTTHEGKTSNVADWDLIVSSKRIADLLHGKTFYHYRPQLEDGKISVLHQSGAKLEFEIMEKFESARVLKLLSKERKKTVKIQNQTVQEYDHSAKVPIIWAVDAHIPSKEALLVLKASHIYFPVNWRKNFQQLVSMSSSFSKSFSKVIKEDPNSSLLKELFQTRARETLHRIKSRVHLSTQRIHAPTIQELRDSSKGHYDRSEFMFKEIQQTKEEPSDTFYLPSTGLKLSKSAWLKYGQDVSKYKGDECVGKALIIYEQLILLALHYYLPQQRDFGFLSNMKKEEQINELFLLCLETFVTQQLVSVTRPSYHPEYKSYFPIPGADIAMDLFSVDLYETVPLASNAELSKTTFANPIVNWLIDNLSTEYEALRTSFARFMKTRDQLFTHKPIIVPNLPFEITEMIQTSVPKDYVMLSKLCRVCRSWNRYFSDNSKWKPLCDNFDEKTQQLAHKRINDKYVQHRGDWKIVFREMYEMMPTAHSMVYCNHCRDIHSKRAGYDYSKIEEEYWGHCACPECDAGSWRDCAQRSDFLFTND
jgi:hypothetical protein